MIKDKSRATDYLADEDLTLSGMFTKTLLLGTDVNQIFFEYGTYSHLRLLWSTKPVLVWLHFAVPVFILLFIIFVLEKIRKRFKDKHITTYDDLLKFSSRKEVKKFNSKANRVFIGDLFLFLSTLTTLIYLCWRVTFSIPFAYGRIAIAGNIILLCVELLGFIQTPQCFYTPDVFQHNLYTEHTVPNEQDYFYDVIEAAKTSSNSVIYGGSNTILSRKALEDIGGFYTKTIKEDFATGMLIETAGYVSLGLSEPLASGIAPSSLAEHVQQRTRWGRGVISTAKQLKFLRNRKLTIAQKFSYLSSVIYWFSPIKNFIYLLAPLMFAIFCIPIFRCNLYDLLLFWFPMHCMQIWSLRITSHGKISTQ
ncbi:MAG: hypothetical protein K6C98_01220 [Treponema sp.]|nr:hypothetical protein [Treponema sp.]